MKHFSMKRMSMKQSPSKFVLFLLLVCTSPLFPQNTQRIDTLSNEGKKALTFAFNGLTLGGGLGGIYWFSDNYALQIILFGSYDYSKDLTDETKSYGADLGVIAYIKRHFNLNHDLSPYAGIGSGFEYSQYDRSYYKEISRRLYSTVQVLIGIEYWLTNNISLSGEQNITFRFIVSNNTREYRVSNLTSSLLLSVYF